MEALFINLHVTQTTELPGWTAILYTPLPNREPACIHSYTASNFELSLCLSCLSLLEYWMTNNSCFFLNIQYFRLVIGLYSNWILARPCFESFPECLIPKFIDHSYLSLNWQIYNYQGWLQVMIIKMCWRSMFLPHCQSLLDLCIPEQ